MPDRVRLDALFPRPGYYILDGTTPVPVEDVQRWGHWLETTERHVALTALTPTLEVSTVFLGLDHNWCAYGPPILFETMVFQSAPGPLKSWKPLDQFTERYSTWEEAAQGHKAVCAQVWAWLHEEAPHA